MDEAKKKKRVSMSFKRIRDLTRSDEDKGLKTKATRSQTVDYSASSFDSPPEEERLEISLLPESPEVTKKKRTRTSGSRIGSKKGSRLELKNEAKNNLSTSKTDIRDDKIELRNALQPKNETKAELVPITESVVEAVAEPVVIIEDTTDYGDAIFGVPDIPRLITMAGTDNPYQIKGATVYKLVERLTSPIDAHADAYNLFLKTFFMTYRSFVTPTKLLDLLIRRFKGPPPGFPQEEIDKWEISPFAIKGGACRAMVHWFTEHYRDFTRERALITTLQETITWAVENCKDNWVSYLQKMIEKKLGKGTYTSLYDSNIMIDKDSCPEPVVPKSWVNITFMDLDDREIARQLTITEYHIYAEIQPVELQDLAWSKSKDKSGPLLDMIGQFNRFSNAVSAVVVTTQKFKQRKAVIEKLIRIIGHLMEIKNFDMVMAILSGFQNAATHRLKHSFEGISKKSQEYLNEINLLFSSQNSYKAYRDMLTKITPPAIPFLGVYLSDLTFIDEGNPKTIGDNLVNFRKKALEYDVIIQVLRYQDHTFQFKMVPKISSIMSNFVPFMSDKELYDASLVAEPRNAKKKELK